jgi:hypothetical protein
MRIAAVGTGLTRIRSDVFEQDESIGLNDRQALEKNLIDQRENRSVSADSQSQSKDRSRGKSRGSAKLPKGVTQILKEPTH